MRTYLNDGWKLMEAPLDWGKESLARVRSQQEGWMDCALPCDVHTPLEKAGRIKDVVLADYSFDAEWIERRSWWFFKDIHWEADPADEAVELVLESLDAYADVFLNGEHLGTHTSAHYPFVAGVRQKLRPGVNELAVRLTSGLEQVSDRDLAELNWAVTHEEANNCPERGDRRRAFLRKPNYTVGWDWAPKVITCGIVKNVYIQRYQKTAIRGVHLRAARLEAGHAHLQATVEIDQLHVYATRDADISIRMALDGHPSFSLTRKDVLLTSGLNYIDMEFSLEDPQLWWPAGYGEQPLYEVEVSVRCEGHTETYPAFRFGIRTLELDTSRTGPGERTFALKVNDVPVFCKGANWIPADSVYARVTPAKYQALVSEARSANFNMLRIWGGGLYETDVFYEACDSEGILLWHDFMFGCSTYPDHLEPYMREVEREMDYQTRRLRNHPAMALWCGNNENHWLFNPEDNPQWQIEMSYEKQYGLKTGNQAAKVAVRNNCPEIPYWNSSPYGGKRPNDDFIGDVHHWHTCMMNPDMNKRIEPKEYDKVGGRFVSEYGYPGPCAKETIAEYFDGQPIDRESKVWKLHTNTFEKRTVNAGIQKHYLDGAEQLDLDDYILYAGLAQSLMLGYSLEAMRFKDFCAGALFWMYNDTWGEVGWTIVDYALRRKISYYGVKRAFAHVKLSLREVNGRVVLQGCNDTSEALQFDAQVGYQRFDGQGADLKKVQYSMEPRSRAYLDTFELPDADFADGAFVVIPDAAGINPAVLRSLDTRQLNLPEGKVDLIGVRREGDDLLCTLRSATYVHGVHIKEPLPCSDNYFDLLPGQEKTVRITAAGSLSPAWHLVR